MLGAGLDLLQVHHRRGNRKGMLVLAVRCAHGNGVDILLLCTGTFLRLICLAPKRLGNNCVGLLRSSK